MTTMLAGAALGLSPKDVAAIAAGIQDDELIAGRPSFDLSYPKIPGRDLEGVPNANEPLMKEKLRQRFLKNPRGVEQLPGFLQGA